MELVKYGIKLHRLRQEDIELVRKWRNSPLIRQYMEFRDEITPEMQKTWFHSINNTENYYFIIEYQQKKIGLINSSHVDWTTRSSEGGIFLWDVQYYETFVPVWASLCLLETSYHILGAGNSEVRILRDNERAQKLVLNLGYELQPGQEDLYNQHYILTPERFFRHSRRLIKAASLLTGQKEATHTLFFDREDILSGLADFIDDKIDRKRVAAFTESVDNRFYEFMIRED
ncbi:MAG: GNAT family N-acetyltransferase [Bacteroidales bacterium]|nr:GNAT family N-acetyltransferase [Lentimicrobiaceae bacterium]MDD5694670.1 GNAT family N-acetyltransferase [Bacteroidales bacterium]